MTILDLSNRKDMFYWQTDRPLDPTINKKVFLDRHLKFDKKITEKAVVFAMTKAGRTKKESRVLSINEPIKYGSINSVSIVKLITGEEVIVRSHPQNVINGYFRVEKLASQKARDLGVPTYKTFYIYDEKKEFDFDFMVIEKLPGKTMQSLWPIKKDLDNKLIYETGKYLALIHQVKTKDFGFYNNKLAKEKELLVGQYNHFFEHIFASLENNLKYLTDSQVISLKQAKLIVKILEKHKDLMETESVLIHNDIADWNTLIDNQQVSGIIDWDECFGGDPVMDFSQWYLFFDQKRMQYLKNGYKEISAIPDNFEDKLRLYNIRYLVSKLTLRKKRLTVEPNNQFVIDRIKRGIEVMDEEFHYFEL